MKIRICNHANAARVGNALRAQTPARARLLASFDTMDEANEYMDAMDCDTLLSPSEGAFAIGDAGRWHVIAVR